MKNERIQQSSFFFRIHFLRTREKERKKKYDKKQHTQKKCIEKERRNVNLKSLHEYAIQMLLFR